VGVACVLNLIQGGYEMQSLGIPSQCVFLNSCSCKQHWISGAPTQIDFSKLVATLNMPGKKSTRREIAGTRKVSARTLS
jgi:uncharacterized protein